MRVSNPAASHASFVVAGAVLIAALLLTTDTTRAQRRRGADNASQGVPVATNTIMDNPDAYYGQLVTLSAGVEEMVSKTAFVLDQKKAVSATEIRSVGKPILVIAPYLAAPVEPKRYLLVRGQVVKFDAATIAKAASGYSLDLAPEVTARYQGQPVLVATSVLSSTYAEMNRKPMLPEEVSLTAVMKTVAPAFAALRAATQDSKPDAVAQSVASLMPAFKETEVVWDNLGQSPAAEWAREASAHAASIDLAAKAGNWDAAKASAGALNQVCQNCHGVYRERQDDGSFRFKAGSY